MSTHSRKRKADLFLPTLAAGAVTLGGVLATRREQTGSPFAKKLVGTKLARNTNGNFPFVSGGSARLLHASEGCKRALKTH
jgi:hypothetical protein